MKEIDAAIEALEQSIDALEYLEIESDAIPVDLLALHDQNQSALNGLRSLKQEPRSHCVQCGQELMSDFTDTCYACNQGPEQSEPICYASINKQGDVCSTLKQRDSWRTVPLYTHPAPESKGDQDEYEHGFRRGLEASASYREEARAYKEAYYKLVENVASLKAMAPPSPS